MKFAALFITALLAFAPARVFADSPYPWPKSGEPTQRLDARIAPPEGFVRIRAAENSFASWLRGLPIKEDRPFVKLYNGLWKFNQFAHHAVVDMDVGERNLQQCADSVIRLHAEHLFSNKRDQDIAYNFTSGDRVRWRDWLAGRRPQVSGSKVHFPQGKPVARTYKNFRRYLDVIFGYAGTISLRKELKAVTNPARALPGDVLIQAGSPGHAVLVLDVAEHSETRKRIYLLGQGYMPAQEFHVLKNPGDGDLSPWYQADGREEIETPQWDFVRADWRRLR